MLIIIGMLQAYLDAMKFTKFRNYALYKGKAAMSGNILRIGDTTT